MPAVPSMPAEFEPHREWLESLLSDSRAVVATLLWEPLFPPAELRQQVLAYQTEIAAARKADQELGAELVKGALALVDAMPEMGSDLSRRLAQVAVRYFVLDDDADDDLLSPFGLDDDVEVFNAVAERIGLNDLVIDYS